MGHSGSNHVGKILISWLADAVPSTTVTRQGPGQAISSRARLVTVAARRLTARRPHWVISQRSTSTRPSGYMIP